MNKSIVVGLAVEALAITLFLLVARKSQLPRGFLGAFMSVYLLVFGAAVSITFLTPELFLSTSRIMLTPHAPASSGTASPPGAMGSYDPHLIQTELEVIQSAAVLDPVIQNLDLSGEWSKQYGRGQPLSNSDLLALLKSKISLRPARNINMIEIRSFDQQPGLAAKIANEIAQVSREHNLSVEAAGSSANAFSVEIMDRAVPGLRPVRPNKPRNIALGSLGGLVLGAAAGTARVHRQAKKKS